jgi:hypothetical protein
VHGTRLRAETRPIDYGLCRYPDGYVEASRSVFPLANTHVPGGCLVGPDTFARVRYCDECRKAERAWHDSHPGGWKVEK